VGLDLDFELRLAVFDHLQRLAALGGGLVPARAQDEGLTFHGERVPIWNRPKGIFRPAILQEGASRNAEAWTSYLTTRKSEFQCPQALRNTC
jgi:hypothetical protein